MKMDENERIINVMLPRALIIRYLDKFILNSKKFDVKDTILLIGTPRSGSTWLMELFSKIPGYIPIFEPENPFWFPESFEAGFRSRTYLPRYKDWSEGEEYLRKIFVGRAFARIPLYQLKPETIMHRLLGDKLVVKSIGLTRMLPWISKRFQLRGIYFIMRHPCAVVASQLKTGWCGYHLTSPPYLNSFPTRQQVLEEALKIEELDPSLIKKLEKIETPDEILAATWCLDNYVPLSLPKPHPWITVIYEKVKMSGREEIVRLFNEIGVKDMPKSTFQNLDVPSMLTLSNEREMVKRTEKQLSKWKEALSQKQIERVLNIVSDFGLDFYSEDIEPDYGNIAVRK